MTTMTTNNWHTANQRYLTVALAMVRTALQRYAAKATGGVAQRDVVLAQRALLRKLADAMPDPPALEVICAAFSLSPFERSLLLLCAGVELDRAIVRACAHAHGEPYREHPTFALALAALPNPNWNALAPNAPLRRWHLIEIGLGSTLANSPLRIDERILHELIGVRLLDPQLSPLVQPLDDSPGSPAEHTLAEQITALWPDSVGPIPAVQLIDSSQASRRAVAAIAGNSVGLQVYALADRDIPNSAIEIERLARLWEREAALSGSVLLIECDDLDGTDASRDHQLDRLVSAINGPVLIAGGPRRRSIRRTIIAFSVPSATIAEQQAVWRSALGASGARLNGSLDLIATQFSLSPTAIQTICRTTVTASAQAVGEIAPADDDLTSIVWQACRNEARQPMNDLAQRIEPAASWNDLVLPDLQKRTLSDVVLHMRQRAKVYQQWGFAAKSARGLGISALFAGGSGTGKTMAAEVLAAELKLDLYRIDLSTVVSKYIGETEKNLRRVFDAAEASGAILLFDEADALFGKRSEIRDSHDRYANIEVSYLLQRIESYRGLAILTTNLKDSLDSAFLRRIRFVVQFPFPDLDQRTEIWRRMFPHATPTEGLDPTKLARLSVAGGNIRNIALGAAFLAAGDGTSVRMAHLLRAAQSECAKIEKPLTASEIRDWV
jgi:SpoVK/Ycf46/Vps4 family AAA+-type ATPase